MTAYAQSNEVEKRATAASSALEFAPARYGERAAEAIASADVVVARELVADVRTAVA